MGQRSFLVLACLLALAGLGALAIHFSSQPRKITLAVGPLGSEDARLAAAFVQGLDREKSRIRLKLVLTAGTAESAQAIEAEKVDLAIIRPDIALPPKADTVIIMRRLFPFFVTGRDRGVERIADMRGKRIGVVSPPSGNIDLLRLILTHYEVNPEQVQIIPLTPAEIVAAVQQQRVDVIFSVGAATARTQTQGAMFLRQSWGTDPVFIPVREADALASRYRGIETGEIVRGAFGGDPPRPAEALPTIAITSRLVARQDLDEDLVGELTRVLLGLRASMAQEVPQIQGIEAPVTDRNSALPVHTGAAAFIDGEQKTFFERYGDWFYLGVMGLSLFGSVGAALLGQMSGTRRREALSGLTRLVAMIGEARAAASESILRDIEAEADELLAVTLENFSKAGIDDAGLSAYRLAMDQLGRAASERRKALSAADAEPATEARQSQSTFSLG